MAFAAVKAAAFVCVFLAVNICPGFSPAEVFIEPRVGFHGVFQLGRPFPLEVELSNSGPPVEGRLEIQVWKGVAAKAGTPYPLSYSKEVFVSAQARKKLQFTIDPDFLSRPLRISFVSPAGGSSRDLDLRRHYSPAPVMLLVSESNTFPPITPLGSSGPSRLVALTLAELPEDPRALLGVSHLVLYDQSLRDLSRYQFLALDRWLISGGQMIILGSVNYALYQEPTISRFLPVRVTGMKKLASLPSFTRETTVSPIADVWVQTSKVMAGGNVLVEAQGVPILVETSRGRGKISYLAPDMGRPPASHWEGFSNLLRTLLAPGTDPQPAPKTRWDDTVFFRVISNPSFIAVYVPTRFLFVAIVGYLAGVVVITWLWQRQRNESARALVLSLCVFVVLAGVGGYLFFSRGGNLPDGVLLSSTVLETVADGYVEAQSNVALFSTQVRRYELQLGRGWLDWFPVFFPSSKPEDRLVMVQDGSGASRFQVQLKEWDHRLFKVRSVERFPFRVQFEQKTDTLLMKIDNQSGKNLTDCSLIVAGRRHALGDIPRGARWTREFPLSLSAVREDSRFGRSDAMAMRDVSFNDRTRDILFHSSLFSGDAGAVRPASDAVIFFGWVNGPDRRIWVDDAGIWAYDYTLFRSILPLATGEDT